MAGMNRLYVDFHVIQTVPPSCVNRDDTGSPKTALYGGVRRARVSSQSWKRAMREMFVEDFGRKNIGIRTKRLVGLLTKEIQSLEAGIAEEEASLLASKVVDFCDIKKKSDKEGQTKALFFVSMTQIHNLAVCILAHRDVVIKDIDNEKSDAKEEKKKIAAIKKEIKRLINKDHGIDMVLFGRMAANDSNLNIEAAAQIAHSISTHRVENEYDYFTALDDLAPEDNPGADMIGVVEFNSSTMYRYATVNVHKLAQELGGEREIAADAMEEFARAFIQSMPTGKQNTFANRTVPDAVLVTIRRDQPVNFVGAFEEPVRTTEGGYVKASIEKLENYAGKIYDEYVDAPEKAWAIGMHGDAEPVNLNGLLQGLKENLLKDLAAPERK